MNVVERFLKYVSMDTTSDESSESCPSSACQWALARYLEEEMKELGLENVQALENGVRMGSMGEITLSELATHVENRLGGVVRRYGEAGRRVSNIGILGGSGGSYAPIAINAGCDVFITGEVSYHTALDILDRGVAVLEAGHAATEYPAVHHMAEKIRALDMDIEVFESGYKPFM